MEDVEKSVETAAYEMDDKINARLHEMEEHRRGLEEELLYLRADVDNFRKAADRELEELRQAGNKELLGQMIPVVDLLRSAIHIAVRRGDEGMATGLEMIMKQLVGVFRRFDMEP